MSLEIDYSVEQDSFPLGSTVFVRTEEPDIFAIGTVEERIDGAYAISYPNEENGRRADPELVPPDLIVNPTSIPGGTEKVEERSLLLAEGARLMCNLDSKLFRFVECLKDTNVSEQESFSALPLTIDSAGAVVPAANVPISVSTRRVAYRPDYVTELRRLQFLAPVDPLIDVYATTVFERWTWRGRARATFQKVTLEGDLVLKVRGHRIIAKMTYPREVALRETAALLNGMHDGILEPLEQGESGDSRVRSWRAERVLWHSGGYRLSSKEEGPQFSIGQFRVPILDVTFNGHEEATVTRDVFEGSEFFTCTDYILKRMPAPVPQFFRANDCIRTLVFGRPAAIYNPPRADEFKDTKKIERFAIVYTGKPLDGLERETLATLLGYLKGGRLRHLSTETFSAARRLTYRRANRGKGTKRLTPPVPLGPFDADVIPLVMAQFPKMLAHLHAWLANDAKGTATVLHHYAEAHNHSYPTTSIILMCVAIDAMISLVTEDGQSNAVLLPVELFDLVEPRLQATVREAFAAFPALRDIASHEKNPTSTTQIRLSRKIRDNLNTVSNTKRLEQFWLERGIALTKKEIALLRLRNNAVHRGHTGGDERNSQTLRENRENALHLANLFNRGALAALLNYDGPVLDASDGESRIRINDGLPYTSAVPPRATTELRIEFAVNVAATDSLDDAEPDISD